jgi:hypothetical protein
MLDLSINWIYIILFYVPTHPWVRFNEKNPPNRAGFIVRLQIQMSSYPQVLQQYGASVGQISETMLL